MEVKLYRSTNIVDFEPYQMIGEKYWSFGSDIDQVIQNYYDAVNTDTTTLLVWELRHFQETYEELLSQAEDITGVLRIIELFEDV